MPRLAGTWFDPKTGWQINAAVIYSVNWENPATNYETGNILNLDGAITKNFGPFGVGAVAYAMIQTTGDSGSGARLGSFESRVYGVGPILTFTTSADPAKALTILIKGYHEFDAQHTFEGNVVDGAVSFKILDGATVDLARSCCKPISRFCGECPLTRAVRIQSRFWRVEANETKDLSITRHRVAIDDFDVHCATSRLLLALVRARG